MNDIMDEICKGCHEYERHIDKPERYVECEGYIRKHIKCPCQHCLIKMMCNDVCEKFKEEWGIFYGVRYR